MNIILIICGLLYLVILLTEIIHSWIYSNYLPKRKTRVGVFYLEYVPLIKQARKLGVWLGEDLE